MSELKPMYDMFGVKIEIGDFLMEQHCDRRYRVYNIQKSIDAHEDVVIMCRVVDSMGKIMFFYSRDLPHIEVIIPEDPKEFFERIPV